MITYPNLNSDPEILKIKTKEDEFRELKFRTEKHDSENILKPFKLIMNITKRSIRVSIKRMYL